MIRTLVVAAICGVIVAVVATSGCNLSEQVEGQEPECQADDECSGGVCVDYECVDCDRDDDCATGVCHQQNCVECDGDEMCDGDDVCEEFQCVSGCTMMDCGHDGECIDDGGSIHCECGEESVLVDGVCEECDCDIENGVGDCVEGICEIVACDEGFETLDDDPETGCECGQTDWPDPVDFTDGNCDGIDGDASRAVFVSTHGDDSNDGAPARPVRSIRQGVGIAADDEDRDQVFIADGVYEEAQPVRLEDNVSIFGGYHDAGTSLDEWERGPEYETVLKVEEGFNDHRPLEIAHNTDDIEVQLLTVEAEQGNPDSIDGSGGDTFAGSSVGIMVYDNIGHVELSHLDVETDRGASGADGAQGQTGMDGQDGDDAPDLESDNYPNGAPHTPEEVDEEGGDCPEDPNLECFYSGAPGGDHEPGDCPDGADGDYCADARECPGGAGGAGGHGAAGTSNAERRGHPGQSVGNVSGGQGGVPEVDSHCSDSSEGDTGESGSSGSTGDDGEPAEQTDSDARLVTGATTGNERAIYFGNSGDRGEHGQPGTSGAGGGGGGGFYGQNPLINCAAEAGGGGGAGGLGGCGGQGGEGGQFGGASIGVVVHSSSVTITDGTITTSVGGAGGDGGIGGDGGDGGSGGQWAHGRDANDGGADSSRRGGFGGSGGDGGQGGGGAGGEGGASIGVAWLGEEPEVDGVDITVMGGGPGGEGVDGAGDGPEGFSAEIHGF